MAMGPLFGSRSGQTSTSKALVEFRAGKMNVNGKTVTADKRKGLITVEQGEDDQLMHFRWKERGGDSLSASSKVEDDLIIFPDDIEFLPVKQCTTGRVYVLKFKDSSRRLFYWMQEPKDDKDEEYCNKVNEYLNKPPSAGGGGSGGGLGILGGSGGGGSGGGSGLDLSSLPDSDLQSLLNNMSQQQLASLFGSASAAGVLPALGSGLGRAVSSSGRREGGLRTGGGASASSRAAAAAAASSVPTSAAARTEAAGSASSTVPAATAAGSAATADRSSSTPPQPATPAIQLTDLQSVLSGIKVPSADEEASSAGSRRDEPSIDLSAGLTAEVIRPLLSKPEFVERMRTLLPSSSDLPDGGDVSEENWAEEISSTVSSPQFKQALQIFSAGLQSGQLAPLIQEFDLGSEAVAAATAGNLEAFVKALSAKKKDDKKPEGQQKDDNLPLD